MWWQKTLTLKPRACGFHLITRDILEQMPEITQCRIGLLTLVLQHTSASLTLNENADPTVRGDFEQFFQRLVPQNQPYYRHVEEGPDDLPAHIKSSLLGVTVTVPVSDGRLSLGTWQGIYLGEHRTHGGARRLVATLQGETFAR